MDSTYVPLERLEEQLAVASGEESKKSNLNTAFRFPLSQE